ncbi:MAG TPA: hypothetical protein VGW76_20100 [Pyrinomonadaceae bacterium]|nr:hypothetical protein [Pyrinomonadaceae bacterium]
MSNLLLTLVCLIFFSIAAIPQPKSQQVLTREEGLAELEAAKAQHDKQAITETESFKTFVYVTVDHYGDVRNAHDDLLVINSDESKKKIFKGAEKGTIWLRLHNDSPLPFSVPSRYFPARTCFYEFPTGQKIFGLCNNQKIAIWYHEESNKRLPIPRAFDFGFDLVVLPKTSVLFAVPLEVLKKGNAIRFDFTFKKDNSDSETGDYGTPKTLRFRESDLPLIY